MLEESTLQFSLLILAANIGFMVMFSAVVAPAVFKALSQNAAGAYLRVLFPRMFIFGFGTSGLASLLAIFENDFQIAVISASIAAGFLINAFAITPQINKYRDKMLAGDLKSKTIFSRLHLVSVTIFLIQLITCFYTIFMSSNLL